MKRVLSFDIGGTNTRLALINERYEIEKVVIRPTIRNSPEDFLESIASIIEEFDVSKVACFGAGVPGVVDRSTNEIITLPNVGRSHIKIGEFIKERIKKDIYVRNDAETACLAEAVLGKGKHYSRVFFITISTGIGGALAIDGKIQDYVTEIGHTAYLYKDIKTPKYVDYEYLTSGNGIVRLCKEHNFIVADAAEFFELVKQKNPNIMPIYNSWLKVLTDFIHLVQNSYHPEVITITGGVMKAKDIFFEDLKRLNPESNLVECQFKEDAGLIGGAVYAFDMLKNDWFILFLRIY